jgi:hypothetical protein
VVWQALPDIWSQTGKLLSAKSVPSRRTATAAQNLLAAMIDRQLNTGRMIFCPEMTYRIKYFKKQLYGNG